MISIFIYFASIMNDISIINLYGKNVDKKHLISFFFFFYGFYDAFTCIIEFSKNGYQNNSKYFSQNIIHDMKS